MRYNQSSRYSLIRVCEVSIQERERERDRSDKPTNLPSRIMHLYMHVCTRYIYQRVIETRLYNYLSLSSSL